MARSLSHPSPWLSLHLTHAHSHTRLFSSSSDPLLRKLEDVIHHIVVRRSEPDWLPFRPGSSYWVPPRSKSRGIARLFGKLATQPHDHPQCPSSISPSSPIGWPSSSYFLHGMGMPPPTPPRMESDETSDTPSQSEDES